MKFCSSSLIRKLIEKGQVAKAASFLGENYCLEGVVVHGEKRGRTIGFPSATLKTRQEVVPALGVYKTLVKLPGSDKLYLGASNVGKRPTFKSSDDVHIETHILDFYREIYDQSLQLFFVRKIRDEVKFKSVDDLVSQIKLDIKSLAS